MFGAPDGFAEFLIGDPFTAREADKWLGHEDAHPVLAPPTITLRTITPRLMVCNQIRSATKLAASKARSRICAARMQGRFAKQSQFRPSMLPRRRGRRGHHGRPDRQRRDRERQGKVLFGLF
jgi:hypothetical protein